LLGHSSVKVTEKHYAPWIRERQEKLELEVRKSWEPQGIIPTATKTEPAVPVQPNYSPGPDQQKKASIIH
jgi:hypothetical protein